MLHTQRPSRVPSHELKPIFDRLHRIADDDPARALLLIGDPKQSIYGFRDAEVTVLDAAGRFIAALRPEAPARAAITLALLIALRRRLKILMPPSGPPLEVDPAMLDHHGHPQGAPVNLVFMGMGEPLHNLDNVVRALEILYSATGFDYSPRKVTLSTAGLVPEMVELGRDLALLQEEVRAMNKTQSDRLSNIEATLVSAAVSVTASGAVAAVISCSARIITPRPRTMRPIWPARSFFFDR